MRSGLRLRAGLMTGPRFKPRQGQKFRSRYIYDPCARLLLWNHKSVDSRAILKRGTHLE